MERKVYLTVIAGTTQISYASSNQFKAQQMCHRLAKHSGVAHAVVTEDWIDLPIKLRIQLRKEFNIHF